MANVPQIDGWGTELTEKPCWAQEEDMMPASFSGKESGMHVISPDLVKVTFHY
jgi:hypothetical protein